MSDFFNNIGLPAYDLSTNTIVSKILSLDNPSFTQDDIDRLYSYPVPEVVESGCGIKAKDPYRLDVVLGVGGQDLMSHSETIRLWRLNEIIKEIQSLTGVDWIGIYRKTQNIDGQDVLLKEAYYGRFSRGEFPLNKDFAKNSNNSTVGLSGKAILVQDVSTYSGPYYSCDVQVQSEFCLPIINEKGDVLGIIDAESFTKDFFTKEKVEHIGKMVHDLGVFASSLLFQKH